MADAATAPAPEVPPQKLDDLMLAMDVVDTLRHQEAMVEKELTQDQRDAALKARLRRIYESQGLEVSDRILDDGIKALRESRFVYTPPPPGMDMVLARMWIRRRTVGTLLAVLVVLIAAVVVWQISRANQAARLAEEIRIEITETLPSALHAAGAATLAAATDPDARAKVEQAIAEGEAAIKAGDAEAMRAATATLDGLRAALNRTYRLRIVSRPGEDTGVFRIPDVNQNARNYYLIVEAVDDSGAILSLPILSEEDHQTRTVSKWGVRVPQATFDAVRADKEDDGIVENDKLGEKTKGGLKVTYLMPIEEGEITSW